MIRRCKSCLTLTTTPDGPCPDCGGRHWHYPEPTDAPMTRRAWLAVLGVALIALGITLNG